MHLILHDVLNKLIVTFYSITIQEFEDKLAHEGTKPNAKKKIEDSKEEKPTAPYWFEDGNSCL